MKDKYMLYPLTVRSLAFEIRTIVDDYSLKKISNSQLEELIFWYAEKFPHMLFSADKLNPTISFIIGKKRSAVVYEILDGFKYEFEIKQVIT